MLRAQLIRDFEEFEARRSDWRECLDRAASAPLQMSHDWLSSWYRILGKDVEFLPLIVYRDKLPVALATFYLRRSRVFGCRFPSLTMNGDVYSNRCAVVMPDPSDEVLQTVVDELDSLPWTLADIERVQEDSPLALLLSNPGSRDSFCVRHRAAWLCPVIRVDQSWQALLASKSANFRKSLKRNDKLAADLRSVRFKSDEVSLDRLLQDVFDISQASWKQTAGTSLAASPQAWEFFRQILGDAAADQRLRINLLYDRDLPIGFIFGIVFKRRLYALKTGYSQQHAERSPGSAVIARFVRDACGDDAIDRVDLDCLTEHGDYKMRWASETERFSGWRLFRRNIAGKLLQTGWQMGRRIKSHKSGSQ